MEIQASNRQYIEQLKDWQAEAFLFVILYCCTRHKGLIWDLSKVCGLYDCVGDIFKWDLVGNISVSVLQNTSNPMSDFEKTKQFKTNIRLLPKDAHTELYNICSIVLEKGGTAEDQKIGAILLEEIAG